MSKLMRRNGNGSVLINRIQEEMDDMFQRLMWPMADATASPMEWSPSVDVEETDSSLVVKADLPGVETKDVEVTLQNGSLMLRGQKKEKREDKVANYHRVERFEGAFYRMIPLPAEVDLANVTASSKNGVVTITIPKKPNAQAKRITVLAKD